MTIPKTFKVVKCYDETCVHEATNIFFNERNFCITVIQLFTEIYDKLFLISMTTLKSRYHLPEKALIGQFSSFLATIFQKSA